MAHNKTTVEGITEALQAILGGLERRYYFKQREEDRRYQIGRMQAADARAVEDQEWQREDREYLRSRRDEADQRARQDQEWQAQDRKARSMPVAQIDQVLDRLQADGETRALVYQHAHDSNYDLDLATAKLAEMYGKAKMEPETSADPFGGEEIQLETMKRRDAMRRRMETGLVALNMARSPAVVGAQLAEPNVSPADRQTLEQMRLELEAMRSGDAIMRQATSLGTSNRIPVSPPKLR